MSEQLADHDHGLGETSREQTHGDREELFDLAFVAELADKDDQIRVPTIQTQVVPSLQYRLQWKNFVVVSC